MVKYSTIFETARVAKNIWRIINTIASIWLWKYAWIFVLGHYLFLKAHSFPRATLSENCSLLGTNNVRGRISEHIFAPNGGYCLYITHHYNVILLYEETVSLETVSILTRAQKSNSKAEQPVLYTAQHWWKEAAIFQNPRACPGTCTLKTANSNLRGLFKS